MMQTMYNQGFKIEFIQQYTTEIETITRIEWLFKMFAPFEEEWGRDISEVEPTTSGPVFNVIASLRPDIRELLFEDLKKYYAWVTGSESANVQSYEFSRKKKNVDEKYFKDAAHLEECLDKVLAPATTDTVDNIYRCYLWLAYMGFTEEEALTMSDSAVDLELRCISFNNKKIKMYTQSIPAFISAKFAETFPDASGIQYKRVEGNKLLRTTRESNPEIMIQNVRRILSKRIRKVNAWAMPTMTFKNTWVSGFFYRLYLRELDGLPISFSELSIVSPSSKELNKSNIFNYKRRYITWKNLYGYVGGDK